MVWDAEQSGQTHACNGEYLIQCRSTLGWTQEEAAKNTGFSERLIRKAESGGTIRGTTLEKIAQVYSNNGTVFHPEDLVCNPRELVERFFEAYRTREKQMVGELRDLLDESIVVKMGEEGDPTPFAGIYHGIEEFDRCMQLFFATFERPDKNFYQPKLMVTGNDVISVGVEKGIIPGMPEPVTANITMHFHIEKGKIVLIEDLYDPRVGLEYIEKAKELGLTIKSIDGEVESILKNSSNNKPVEKKDIDDLPINRFK